MEFHVMSDFIDDVKESLTDAQYKQGMEICQTLFKRKEANLYRMTYLSPFTFTTDHDCDDIECDIRTLKISFVRKTALVRLTGEKAEKIREKNLFMGSDDDMREFIEVDVLKCFPVEADDVGMPFEWFDFPVISLELIE
jgi:hypothetical protein